MSSGSYFVVRGDPSAASSHARYDAAGLGREAFRWSVVRRVELRIDPEDMTRLDVFWKGR